MRDFISVEYKRLTNDQIIEGMPQGCTHYALPKVNLVRYYLITSKQCLVWKNGFWVDCGGTFDGLIRFGIIPVAMPKIDYSFMYD